MTTRVSISVGGTGAFNAANALSALNAVSKSGDTMIGNLIMSNATINTNTANISTITTANLLTIQTAVASNGNIIFASNGTEDMRITNTGFIGIFTTTPNSNLSVVGNVWVTTGINAATLNVTTANITNIAASNVGIGTAVPNANLHITGTIIDTPVLTITGNATYNENAAGRVILANTTSAVTVTIANSTTATAGFTYTVIRGNSGNVTIANSGVTRLNSATYSSLNIVQNGAATVVYTATNQVFVFGDFV